ncbi:MAG: hypothetical protein ABJJ53_09890 [Sulfitobacter sp.]
MPTLHIHSGFHKTGTTSLQKAFFDTQAGLDEQGFLYPQTGLSKLPNNWGHHDLAYSLRNRPTAQKLWAELRAEADASGLPNIVVSSEELSLVPFPDFAGADPYKLIANQFEGYDIRLICYLRPQADMAASLYNHNVKAAGEVGDPLDFLVRVAKRLNYIHYLNTAASGLGRDAVVVRRYQKAHMQGDTIRDFAAQIGLKEGVLPAQPKSLNLGLTDKGLAEMLAANRRYKGNPLRLQAARLKIIHAHRAPNFQSASPFSADTRATITALHKLTNMHIAKRYLRFDGDLFD